MIAIRSLTAPPGDRPLPLTAEEWKKELRDWIESHAFTGPPLPDEALSRQSIYEDRR